MLVYRVVHTVAPSVFSQVDMFHAIAAAARGGHHFIYTILNKTPKVQKKQGQV